MFPLFAKNVRFMVNYQKICITSHKPLVQKLNTKRHIPSAECRISGAIILAAHPA